MIVVLIHGVVPMEITVKLRTELIDLFVVAMTVVSDIAAAGVIGTIEDTTRLR